MLTDKIIDYMERNQYQIFRGEKLLNIVYIEGMNPDGSLNDDAPNYFNDVRMVIGFEGSEPIALGIWEGTTEPGRRYTVKPMNPKGAARIAFGQYRAWAVGRHGNSEPHEALIQVAAVKVHRDYNKDFIRTGDRIDEGLFGINQHYGYDLPRSDIGLASAGCLVGRTRAGHREFMRVVKSDRRYQENKNFIFTTTIIPGDKL
ncbi:hypothetical protein ACE1CI_03245 [Aerosakkonemataceae cyanobacterium BLCC-F50]|uniref:Peptidoglycan-binding protein n=1 Tax=Floridaenema flaviceps BLCC-F50 TaxID=3153642 RepID=A0ABV4XKJ1_9CYAN